MDNLFRSEAERQVELTARETAEVLAALRGSELILESAYFDNWDLPCPARVLVKTSSGSATVVLRKSRSDAIEYEVGILSALKAYGLAVPEILRPPFPNEQGVQAAVYQFISGQNLQKLSSQSAQGLLQARDLMVEALAQLAGASSFMRAQGGIPELSLAAEWEALSGPAHPWQQEPAFQSALKRLEVPLKAEATPLVFTNGDSQPGNFLAENGKLCGFLDFEASLFQDPLMALVKYPIDDLYPLCRTDLIRVFLSKNGFTKEAFGLRLALGCLKKLKNDIAVSGGDEAKQKERQRALALLEMSGGVMKHENLSGLE